MFKHCFRNRKGWTCTWARLTLVLIHCLFVQCLRSSNSESKVEIIIYKKSNVLKKKQQRRSFVRFSEANWKFPRKYFFFFFFELWVWSHETNNCATRKRTDKRTRYQIIRFEIVKLSWVSFSNFNVYARNCLSKVINVLCVRLVRSFAIKCLFNSNLVSHWFTSVHPRMKWE